MKTPFKIAHPPAEFCVAGVVATDFRTRYGALPLNNFSVFSFLFQYQSDRPTEPSVFGLVAKRWFKHQAMVCDQTSETLFI